jgi:hypothetical protein
MDIERLIRLVSSWDGSITLHPTTEQPKQNSRFGPAQARAAMPHETRTSGEAASLKIAMRLRYKGRERTTELSLTQDVIRQLLSEAEFRRIRIGEFVGDLITTVAKKDLFRQVLDAHGTDALDKVGAGTDPRAHGRSHC